MRRHSHAAYAARESNRTIIFSTEPLSTFCSLAARVSPNICKQETHQEGACSPPEIAKILRKLEKKRKWSYQEPILLQCCHVADLQRTWRAQKNQLFRAWTHGYGKEGWDLINTKEDTYWKFRHHLKTDFMVQRSTSTQTLERWMWVTGIGWYYAYDCGIKMDHKSVIKKEPKACGYYLSSGTLRGQTLFLSVWIICLHFPLKPNQAYQEKLSDGFWVQLIESTQH